ncbi:hypothetical protein NHL50_17510 [Acidimicrobiia bacterium EGI L10123]|uniref:hypothetical protein n=1 Tax=Salinilacustrithrix flava TaxID=2957203 RepID=UPI003D7C2EBC|nr:hypothetical protein [Acidimicrobiia bacterium EGI L10123]
MILAHGVGSRADLPVEPWLFAYSAAFALLISFAALRLLWPRPRLADAAAGTAAPAALGTVASVLGTVVQALALVLFGVTLLAAWFGEDAVSANLAPTALYIALWIGMQVASAVLGDVWRRINPLWTVASALDRVRGRDPETSTATGWWASNWPAALGLLAFHWLELAYFEPASLTAVAAFISAYTIVVLVAASRFGAGWVRTGDGFAVLFGLLGALSPLHRDDGGRLRLRVPGAGLAAVELRRGSLGVVLVVLGGTTFDGVTRTQWWSDLVGGRREWDLTAVNTVGLLLTIATVAMAYLVAIRVLGALARDDTDLMEQARRWGPSLIPIVLGYSIAHYFSLLVFEGQSFLALLSDPLGSGRDLFGTAENTIDFTVVTADQIAYTQVAAIVIGHIAGVIAAHDKAVERYPHRTAVLSQYPLLAVMVAYTVSGLLLLLNA